MKKIIGILVAITMVLSLAGCGGNSAPSKSGSGNGSNSVQNVLNQQMNDADKAGAASSETVEKTESAKNPAAVAEREYDVDLTELSSTMVYSEVYNMMCEPDDYVGKMIRMNGQFTIYQAADAEGKPIPGQIYYACVIADATACCSQGLEFVLAGDYHYPEDYPEIGDEIMVSGIFEIYDEDGYEFCHLVDAIMEQTP